MITGVVELMEDGGEEVLVVCSSKKKILFFVSGSDASCGLATFARGSRAPDLCGFFKP